MSVTAEGYTDYHTTYDLRGAARRRLGRISGTDSSETEFSKFQSQLESNQRAFDEQMQMRQAGLDSLAMRSQNADSLNEWGSDLLGRINAQMNPWESSWIGAGVGSTGNEFDALTRSIAHHESGGSYSAVNQHSGALGKYQIMPFNISSWSKQALGYAISPSQFLSSPQYQEQIARHQLRNYYNQYGAAGAAVAWYAGPGAANRFVSSGYASTGQEANGYPSVYGYLNNIMGTLRRFL